MNSTQDAEFKNAWKESYSIISQASKLMAQDNGGSLSGLFTDDTSTATSYKNYLKTTQTCSPPNGANCITSMSSVGWVNQFTSLALNNGSSVLFDISNSWVAASTCSDTAGSISQVCLEFWLDVNGNKGPNINGRDLLGGVILGDGRVIPFGTSGFTGSRSCPGGASCNSYKYLMNN